MYEPADRCRMKIKIVIAACLVFLSGCATAEMVNPPGGSGAAYAPSNDSSRPGMIKYLNQGADFVIKGRRDDAYKKMSEACSGKYSIVSEGPNSEGGTVMPVGNSMMFMQSQYWYITFKCD